MFKLCSCPGVHWHYFVFLQRLYCQCLGLFILSRIWIFDPGSPTNIGSKFWLLQSHFLSAKYLLPSVLWSLWIRASRYLRSSLDVSHYTRSHHHKILISSLQTPFNTSSEENSFWVLVQGCGRIDCKRIELVLQAILPLMGCSCTNYQRVETAFPLIGHSYVQ